MQRDLLHVLDLATLRDWSAAKTALESLDDPAATRLFSLISELDFYDAQRRKAEVHLRHEIGNALSIVRANLEGIIDEVVPATPERLKGMSEALAEASLLLDDLRQEPEPSEQSVSRSCDADLSELVAAQCAMIGGLAEPKSVKLISSCSGSVVTDVERSAQLVRDVLIASVRFAPPLGTVAISRGEHEDELAIHISGFPADPTPPRMLLRAKAIGAVTLGERSLAFSIRLPAGQNVG